MISVPLISLVILPTALCSILPPSTTSRYSPRAANQQLKCNVNSDAWPKLWLDIVLLVDNSGTQSISEFNSMIALIKEIWEPDSGGPIVGQETEETRVGVIAFNSSPCPIARLDEFHSNADLINALDTITQTSSPTVNGAGALAEAAALLSPLSAGSRSNAPNVIVIYTANWDGNDACSVAQLIMRSTVIIVVAFDNLNQTPVNIPPCIYWPGELYAPDASLDLSLLESLSYVNCACPGKHFPNNTGRIEEEKSDRALPDQWYQFWLPRNDSKYYLRDKWAECVNVSVFLTHDQAQDSCHRNQASLSNEFSMEKHTFLINMAQAGNFISQWNGLQYDNATQQWFWDNFDQATNQPTRILVEQGDFTFWDANQPDIIDDKYCVKDSPSIGGQPGFRWTSTKCNDLLGTDPLRFFCQKPACDALNYCSDA